jgi:histone deacetylase 1/2
MGNDGHFTAHQLSMANAVSHVQTLSSSVDPRWYVDTGSTDHVTNDFEKMHVKETYTCQEQVHVANGIGMHFFICQALLPTPSSCHLHLRNILHVPDVTKNILSVKKFTRDNNVFIEFQSSNIFVKDLAMRDVLLRGRCHGGLYALDEPPIKQALSSHRASSTQWHARLGHPSSQIV